MLTACLRSSRCQAAGVALAFGVVALMHRDNDGLWYADAPTHAANGVFWWDFLRALPTNPIDFALSYYARYPVIKPAAYPPLFYVLEGVVFAVTGPSPHVAKGLVLLFGVLAGLYTTAWARRWVGPAAGWAGAFLAFVPVMVVWSHAVMLNVPAAALSLASLYHARRWIDEGGRNQLVLSVVFLAAALLTYYLAASVLCVFAACLLPRMMRSHVRPRLAWIVVAAVAALAPLALSIVLGPVYTSRHLPSVSFLMSPATWTFYPRMLPDIIGATLLALASIAAVVGSFSGRWRKEVVLLAEWVLALMLGLSLLPARDPRYIMLAAPALLLLVAVGIAAASKYVRESSPSWSAGALAAGLALGVWSASRVPVPHVSGFSEIASYLREHAPSDAVLYDGPKAGIVAFYMLASDPMFERRMAEGEKLVYYYGPSTTFRWIERTYVASRQDVVDLVRTQCGCRWIALEVWPNARAIAGRRLLRDAVAGPEFAFVRSFVIHGAADKRVDLFRVVGAVDPVRTVDLRFPGSTGREYRQVVPISR